mgnify:CR=1 FL=1
MEFVIIFFILYFLPSVIAVSQKKSNTLAIVILNLVAGWTLIGWIVALVWAATKDNK